MRRGPVVTRYTSPVDRIAAEAPASTPAHWFTAWSAAAREIKHTQLGALVSPERADARFADELSTAAVVSFDVFDTLVTRACATASDVFLFLSLEEPFSTLGLSASDIRGHRHAAEMEARRARAAQSGTDAEVTLTEIHTALASRLNLASFDALANAELRAEHRLLRANPRVVAWLEAARTHAERVIIISDTWYSAPQVQQLLNGVGIDVAVADIFTSADARLNKQEGSLDRKSVV